MKTANAKKCLQMGFRRAIESLENAFSEVAKFMAHRQNTFKSLRLKSSLRQVSEGVQSLVKLIQRMNNTNNTTFVDFAF